MDENSYPSIGKAIIKVSRNTPVALVVGAAGFLGSFLTEKLLDHNMAVVGVDNFQNGTKDNLTAGVKNSHFHLINENAENLSLDLPRLDYIFILASEDYTINKILNLSRAYKSKIIFVSWIDLYDHKSTLSWFKKTEGEIAQFAKGHNLNARVLRLSAVFGPRMNFKVSDPMVNLIAASLKDRLQEESGALEFSTRAIYVADAVNLIIKSMFIGSTAWKIFDGTNPNPVKVSEVKQILLDPIWYDQRGFTPSELPPWPTPNLERTMKELHWHPKVDLVKALKETITYFKEHGFNIPDQLVKIEVPKRIDKPKEEERRVGKAKLPKLQWGKLVILALFFYALVYPLMTASLGLTFLNFKISSIIENYQKGEFDMALVDIRNTKIVSSQVADSLTPFFSLGNIILKGKTENFENQLVSLKQGLTGAEHLNLGTSSLILALKAITGEKSGSPGEFLYLASTQLAAAEGILVPISLKTKDSNITSLTNLAVQNRNLTKLLPALIGPDSDKNYLVLLQDNNELTPTGGVVSAIALVSFKNGKLEPIQVIDPIIYKNYKGEADFKASSRGFITLFNQTNPVSVDGILTFDLQAASDLLDKTGDLNLNGTKVTGNNLITLMTAKQGSKEFPVEFTREFLEKTLYLFYINFTDRITSFQQLRNNKHIQFFFKDPKLANLNPTDFSEEGDLLAVVESNTGSNKANYFLDKSFGLEIKEGEHKLTINFTNRSPNEVWPGGSYMAKMAIFTPLGSKLTSVKFGEEDLTAQVNTAVDYNKTVYGVSIELLPKEAKSLNLVYQTNKFNTLTIIKQAGSGDDPWVISLPGGKIMKIKLTENQKIDF